MDDALQISAAAFRLLLETDRPVSADQMAAELAWRPQLSRPGFVK